jgi:hypothetical protein
MNRISASGGALCRSGNLGLVFRKQQKRHQDESRNAKVPNVPKMVHTELLPIKLDTDLAPSPPSQKMPTSIPYLLQAPDHP